MMFGFSLRKENVANVHVTSLDGAAVSSKFGSGEGVVCYSIHVSHTGAAKPIFELRENTVGGALVLKETLTVSGNLEANFPRGLPITGTAAYIVVTATGAEVTITFANGNTVS